METFVKAIDRLSNIAGVASAILVMIGLILIMVEIIIRGTYGGTLLITLEYVRYITCAVTFLALGYTLKEKGHIRVNFLQNKLNEQQRLKLEMYSYVVGFVVGVVLTIATFNLFYMHLQSGSTAYTISQTPMAIPTFFMPVGLSIFSLQFAAEFFRSLIMLRTGQSGEVESSALGR